MATRQLESQLSKGEATDIEIIATGSPSAFANSIQFGATATAPGSTATVTFGTAFQDVPQVSCTANSTTANRPITISGATATGFTAYSHGAGSVAFDWIACGSGVL